MSEVLLIVGTVAVAVVAAALAIHTSRLRREQLLRLSELKKAMTLHGDLRQEIYLQSVGRGRRKATQPTIPPQTLRLISDLIPGPNLRRRVRKMLADQETDIDRLRKDGRTRAAMWMYRWTWLIFVVMVLAGPVDAIRRLIGLRRSA